MSQFSDQGKKRKRERERTQINKIRDEKGEVTTHTNKMDSLEETEKFLERYNLPRLNQEEA